ncbi:MAG TPA: hypothetical protein VHN98_03445 [Acidimicrobiales bacterium]|nr:hypothetical protein [Acidimicrobiales bacterium]
MLIFLLLLLLAVQVVYDLYATSVVTAAAWDGARIAAGAAAAGDPSGQASAEDHVRDVLGAYGRDRVRMTWGGDTETIALRVQAKNPSFLPPALKRPLGIDSIDRTVRVHIEQEVGP